MARARSPASQAADRDAPRGNTRMRFEQWAKNAACQANTFSAVHNVRMTKIAEIEKVPTTFGQSPFALARGNTFERDLFRRDGERMVGSLVEAEVLLTGSAGLADMRLRMNGGPRLTSLDKALDETKALLETIASARSKAERAALPAVVAAPTVRIPKGVMLPEAILIIDVLAIRTDTERPLLTVGEVKTYPDRGGHTDPHELAVARAQAGVYLHALRLVVDEMGLSDSLTLNETGFLVLSRPGSNWPSVRAGELLRHQAERARRGFERLEAAAQVLPHLPGEPPVEKDVIEAIIAASTSYSEACLGFCDRAQGCFQRALEAGDPIVLGEDVWRFVGEASLPRVLELLGGDEPVGAAEVDLVRRINEAEAIGL